MLLQSALRENLALLGSHALPLIQLTTISTSTTCLFVTKQPPSPYELISGQRYAAVPSALIYKFKFTAFQTERTGSC